MTWNPLNKVKFKVATVGIGITLFHVLAFKDGYTFVNSGFGKYAINIPDDVYEISYDENIPEEYIPGTKAHFNFELANLTDDSTVNHNLKELSYVQSVNINPSIDDLSGLNYMKNVEQINIDTTENCFDIYRTIDGSVFNKPLTVKISGNEYFSDNNFSFLKDVPVIEKLVLGEENTTLIIDSKFLESLTNVRNLEIGVTVFSNINFNNLTHLKSLTINGLPYDVAMFISNNDIKTLEDAGVEINITSKDELIKVNKKIDDIVASLNVTDDMTEQEKLNRVVAWVLNNYHYDKTSHQLITEGKESEIDVSPFYKEGYLTASLENDGQICGNYAAMVTALLHRLNIESYFTCSLTHAWNTVKIDGEYYTVDTTNLDNYSQVRKGIYAYILNEYGEATFLTEEELENLPDSVEVHYVEKILEQSTAGEIFNSGDQEKIDNFKDMGYMCSVRIENIRYNPIPQTSLFIEPDFEIRDYNKLYKDYLTNLFLLYLIRTGAWTTITYIISKSDVLKEDSKEFVKKIK